MGDLFAESVSDAEIKAVLGIVASCPRHTFMILTKRTERMKKWFDWLDAQEGGPLLNCLVDADGMLATPGIIDCAEDYGWPLKNLWVGTTVENQEMAEKRISWLLETPAVVHFLSVEPMLSSVDIST